MERQHVPVIIEIDETLRAVEHAETYIDRFTAKLQRDSGFYEVRVSVRAARGLGEGIHELTHLPTAVFMRVAKAIQDALSQEKTELLKKLKEL